MFSPLVMSIWLAGKTTTTEGTDMVQKITPCLWFDGQAEEAAKFYISVFRNSRILEVVPYGEAGPGRAGTVMVVSFELDGQEFVGLNGGPEFSFNESISFQIECADQAEVDHYWDRLSDGGKEGPCGWLSDRFGVSWQVVPERLHELFRDPDQGRANRAVQAMLRMQRIDIAALERAADGA